MKVSSILSALSNMTVRDNKEKPNKGNTADRCAPADFFVSR